MHVETVQACSRIRRMVKQLACPAELREDYMQEALIHLWRMETECPGRTLSWYCKACCFHVHHEAVRGRSIDSPKRGHLGTSLGLPGDEVDEECEGLPAASGTPLEACCVRDILHQLSRRLNGRALKMVYLFARGNGVREVAAYLGLSHTAVSKQRRRIRAVAEKIGIRL